MDWTTPFPLEEMKEQCKVNPRKKLDILKDEIQFFSVAYVLTQKINDGYVKMDQFINSKFELNTLELIDQGYKIYINRFQS